MPAPHETQYLQNLAQQLWRLRDEVLAYERRRAGDLQRVAPDCRASAHNLIHYLDVRIHDLRGLQRDLARLGLGSLGRMEANVSTTR